MTIESARNFVERMKSDEEFVDSVTEAKTKEERMEIAKAEGFDFTPDELKAVAEELSDEELDAVAGGAWCGVTHEAEACCMKYEIK